MNWDAIGAVGEIVGAIAVVLSLVYLGAQIRQNTRQVEDQCRGQRQNSLLGARSAFHEWRSLVIQNPSVAAIWKKGRASLGQLTEDERVQMDFMLIDFFWAFSTIWMQVEEGLADESFWDVAKGNIQLYAGPGVREWWSNSPHRGEYPEAFTQVVDAILARDAA